MIPLAAHRSSVRVETPWRSAFLRQDSRRLRRRLRFGGGGDAMEMSVMSGRASCSRNAARETRNRRKVTGGNRHKPAETNFTNYAARRESVRVVVEGANDTPQRGVVIFRRRLDLSGVKLVADLFVEQRLGVRLATL